MKKGPIATIVTFSTTEARFLKALTQQAALFSEQIIVSHCERFFDGREENYELLEKIYRSFPDTEFIRVPLVSKLHTPGIGYLTSVARRAGASLLRDSIKTVLFLDGDEVPDGARFQEWLAMTDLEPYHLANMAAYWYFREARYQAIPHEEAGLLIDREILTHELLLGNSERSALIDLPVQKIMHAGGLDGEPLMHHFSWVRSQEEMLRKVASWGHFKERDWNSLVEEEFRGEFKGTDFVHGYPFREISPAFDVEFREVSPASKRAPRVTHLTQAELLALLTTIPTQI